jgi:tetratricopeptide (TPR) repeat protein
MRRLGGMGCLIFALLAGLLLPTRLAAMAEAPVVAKVVSCQGQVAVRRGDSAQWEPAQVGQPLWATDTLRTGPASRASILCVDESQIKLNENTTIILKSIAPSPRLREMAPAAEQPPPASHYEVPEGEIWLRNKHEKFRFELDTPAVTATIRGTELNVRVQRNGTTSVILLEGNVCLTNPQGEVCLVPGEEGYSAPGQKPSKRVLVQPADAVQWVLYYPGIFSYRDLPLAALPAERRSPAGIPAVASLVQKGEAAYDQGRLDEARQDAEAALRLAPDHSRVLTLLGWISLQKDAPEKAQDYFRRARQPDDLTVVGLALCRYRLGDATGAYEYIRPACQQPGASALLTTMGGYFALMAGQADEARARLAAVPPQSPVATLAQSLLAQIYLVQNRKEAALREASAALSRSPGSPAAQLSFALVKMAAFDLRGAAQSLEKAIRTDPTFVPAYVYLAKIWLGSEYLGRAQKTVDQALSLAPRDPQVLSLAGFVRLAYRDYRGAFSLWERAVKFDPRFGEPHLGLGIYYFRFREFRPGLEQMLTATLLDPRVASYQTELGKALYQTRSFGRALEVYDYAKTLDPKDPTPYYYKGIALSDLNRPGEAVQEINKSIELNDNVAMFRSRSLLDQDRAVRNASLARAYQQLGLTDWALSKAVTAVKYKPYDSSAHLFLEDVLLASRANNEAPALTAGLLFSTANTEAALYRVLSPANQATFSNLQLSGTEALGLTNDYTPMFEMPYARLGVSGGLGVTEGSKSIQEHQGFVYGGLPGAAFNVYGSYSDDQGLARPTDATLDSFGGRLRRYNVQTAAKWEPTVQGTLTGLFQYAEQRTSTQFSARTVAGGVPITIPQATTDETRRGQFYEAAYYHRFNPNLGLLGYFSHQELPRHNVSNTYGTFNFTDPTLPGFAFPSTIQDYLSQTFDREFNNVQFQQHLRLSFLGRHNLITGFDYFSSNVSQRINQYTLTTIDFSALIPGFIFTDEARLRRDFLPPYWSYSFYLMDYWRPHKNLVLEWALFKDFTKSPQRGFPGNFYTSLWSPRFGANYMFGIGPTQHVLRAALERHLTTHILVQPLLVPSEVASFPWAIDTISPNAEVRQAGVAWEAQWNPRTFTALRLNALRVAEPDFVPDDNDPNRNYPIWRNWKRYQTSLALNRIITTSLGLSLGVMGKRIVPDLSYGPDLQAYSEFNAFLGLAYMHPQGWLARMKPLLVQQYGNIPGHTVDNPFVIVNLTLGREFPNKRGFALFEVQNLFNRQVFYSLEPFRDLEFSNQRRFLFKLGLYF